MTDWPIVTVLRAECCIDHELDVRVGLKPDLAARVRADLDARREQPLVHVQLLPVSGFAAPAGRSTGS